MIWTLLLSYGLLSVLMVARRTDALASQRCTYGALQLLGQCNFFFP
jgi:hypothetical protein